MRQDERKPSTMMEAVGDLNLSQAGTWAPSEGTSTQRSGIAKACGQTVFPSDLVLPGMLVGRVLHSPHPHCLINGIGTARACSLPGVRAVLTAGHIPGVNRDLRILPDQPLIAHDRARTVMDVIALVAAESEEAAQAALNAIDLDVTPLPAVFDIEAALRPDAPQLHPNGNLAYEFRIVHGDVDAGLAEADVIVENLYTFPWIEHAYLETEIALAAPGRDGTMTVWLGSHDAYSDRMGLSLGFGWPEERFRVILLPPGGSFGGKHTPVAFYAALLAHYTGCPVRMHYSRRESLRGHAKRGLTRIYHRLGARADGELTVADVRVIRDTGAYTHWGPLVIDFSCMHAAGPYRIPHAHIYGCLVYTNNLVSGGMRGIGTPQVEFAAESQMDAMARRLRIDPLALRRMNALREGDETITGRLAPGCNFVETLDAADRSRNCFEKACSKTPLLYAGEGNLESGEGRQSIS